MLAISLPEISQSIKDKDIAYTNTLCRRISLHQFLTACFIFLLIWINIDFVFELLPNGKIYASGKWVVFFIGLSRLIDSSFSVSLAVLNFSKYYYYSLLFTFALVGLVIASNLQFIPIFGMTGAALAMLVSYTLYIISLLIFTQWKLKINPLSYGLIKVVVTALLIIAISWLWKHFVSPHLFATTINQLLLLFINATGKTVLALGIGFLLVYKWKVSDEVNNLVDKFLSKIGINLGK